LQIIRNVLIEGEKILNSSIPMIKNFIKGQLETPIFSKFKAFYPYLEQAFNSIYATYKKAQNMIGAGLTAKDVSAL